MMKVLIGIVLGIVLGIGVFTFSDNRIQDIQKSMNVQQVDTNRGLYRLLIVSGNGLWYGLVWWKHEGGTGILYCLFGSLLLALSVIDFHTFVIPPVCTLLIGLLGCVRLCLDLQHCWLYLYGLLSVSSVLLVLFWLSKGKLMGGGDVKLMAACGLLLGWRLLFVGFFLGCFCAVFIHPIRMSRSKAGNVLAMGPYFSFGTALAVLWGDALIAWYTAMS